MVGRKLPPRQKFGEKNYKYTYKIYFALLYIFLTVVSVQFFNKKKSKTSLFLNLMYSLVPLIVTNNTEKKRYLLKSYYFYLEDKLQAF